MQDLSMTDVIQLSETLEYFKERMINDIQSSYFFHKHKFTKIFEDERFELF